MFRKSVLPLAVAVLLCAIGPAPIQGQRGPQGQRGQQAQAQLPDGNGKEMVQNTCSQCHALSLVTNAGYSREEWQTVFSAMVDLSKGSVCRRSGIFGQELPRETETSGGGDSRKRDGLNQGVIPSGGGVVRNMMATPDGNLVMACSGRNRVALVQLNSNVRSQ